MTLEDLTRQPPGTLDALPIATLAALQEQAEARLAEASQMVAILHGVFTRRYAEGLNDTGTIRRQDGAFAIKVTVPKSVAWDQAALAGAVETIRSWGEDPADYVETKMTVSETRYKAWPPAIRDLFAPARTVKPGKPRFEIALAEKGAA